MEYDVKYMRRALQLAARSPYYTHPNPMVGAVIVCDDVIIGEGWHRQCGKGHAEVNAVNSVVDKDMLKRSTMYVTLEPCSHYGKTPPCAKLIIDVGIPRVVVGSGDPNVKVSGRGIAMLREAGVEVVEGVLAEESRELNKRFITAHTLRRPFVTLKWAQSADGFMDRLRKPGEPAARISTPETSLLTQQLRAEHDALLTTAATVNADDPLMTVRGWGGPSPRRIVVDRSGSLQPGKRIVSDVANPTWVMSPSPSGAVGEEWIETSTDASIADILAAIYERGITSVLVEAGPRMLSAFIASGLWDVARVETGTLRLGEMGTAPTPAFALSSEPEVTLSSAPGIAFFANEKLANSH